MTPIPIFIPVVNRLDLTYKAVGSIPADGRWQAEVINNTGEPLPDDLYAGDCNPCVPLTASQSLNYMQALAKAWPTPFYCFMHNDAEAVGDTVQRLVAMANAYTIQKRKWAVIFTAYDALAAFNTAAFDAVGPWDTNFTQYYTDNDMYRRLRLAGYEMIESNLPVNHVGSQTLKSDPLRQRINAITFPIYERYYRTKWGGGPGEETFERPWNE